MANINRAGDSSASNSTDAELFPLKLDMTSPNFFQYLKFQKAHLIWWADLIWSKEDLYVWKQNKNMAKIYNYHDSWSGCYKYLISPLRWLNQVELTSEKTEFQLTGVRFIWISFSFQTNEKEMCEFSATANITDDVLAPNVTDSFNLHLSDCKSFLCDDSFVTGKQGGWKDSGTKTAPCNWKLTYLDQRACVCAVVRVSENEHFWWLDLSYVYVYKGEN